MAYVSIGSVVEIQDRSQMFKSSDILFIAVYDSYIKKPIDHPVRLEVKIEWNDFYTGP